MRTIASLVGVVGVMTATGSLAQTTTGTSIPVNPDNFVRAETDLYFGGVVKDGGFDWTGSPPSSAAGGARRP